MARVIWTKVQAKKAIETIAAQVAESFGIEAPRCFVPDYRKGRDWKYQFETVEVWTKAGVAEMNVAISSTFAHMYFRFDDPKRAKSIAHGFDRLNRHSGKWNSLVSAPVDLGDWVEQLKRDFATVAEPNPPADEVAAYEVARAIKAAQWAEWASEWNPVAGLDRGIIDTEEVK